MSTVDSALSEAIKAAVAEAVTEALERAGNVTGERAWTVEEAMERLGGLSRPSFYKLVATGDIRLRKIGSRSVVLQSEIDRFLHGLPVKEAER